MTQSLPDDARLRATEAQMRRALGLAASTQARSAPIHTTSATYGSHRQRHRFVRDGDVPGTSSFVGTTNQIAKPARTNGTPLGKPCSSVLRPENFLSGSCMRRRSPTNRTETMAVPNGDLSEAKLPYRPKDNSSFTGAAFRGSGLLFAMWRDPQGDGRMRPGDWLVLLIGSALIIVTALVFL